MNLVMIAIPWTIIILYFLYSEYKSNKKWDWFKYSDVVFSYISHIMLQITFGITIWFNIFSQLTPYEFIKFTTFGVLFMILSIIFRSIHSERIKKEFYQEHKKLMKLMNK